jgi:hypothetical protein
MKKQINILLIILLCSCSRYYVPVVQNKDTSMSQYITGSIKTPQAPVVKKEHNYTTWRAEQDSIIKSLGEKAYAADAKKNNKRSLGDALPSTAKSLVGTSADPFGSVRNTIMIPDQPIRVEIRTIKY